MYVCMYTYIYIYIYNILCARRIGLNEERRTMFFKGWSNNHFNNQHFRISLATNK